VASSRLWIKKQLEGGHMLAVLETLEPLSNEKKIVSCGFIVPNREQIRQIDMEKMRSRENEMATRMAHLALSMVFHRTKRMLYLLIGPAARSYVFADGDPENCEAETELILADAARDLRFQDLGARKPGLDALNTRSIFRHVNIQQMVLILKTSASGTSERARYFFKSAHARLMTSLTNEDAFNNVKNQPVSSNKEASLEFLYAELINSKLLDTKYKFQEVPLAQSSVIRGASLPPHAYRFNALRVPQEFSGVMSWKQATTTWSPRGNDWSIPWADLVLREFAEGPWGFPLGYLPESCVFL
jgi:hypothetical protein